MIEAESCRCLFVDLFHLAHVLLIVMKVKRPFQENHKEKGEGAWKE